MLKNSQIGIWIKLIKLGTKIVQYSQRTVPRLLDTAFNRPNR